MWFAANTRSFSEANIWIYGRWRITPQVIREAHLRSTHRHSVQTDMKRLLAYSSIAHAGYALLDLIAGTPEGAAPTMTYAFFYVFMTLGTFGVVGRSGRAR